MPSVMDAVKTALKYLLKKLYAFGIFAIEARSTAWPGISRFTIWILFAAFFLNLVQIALTMLFALSLGKMPKKAAACYMNSSTEGIRRYDTNLSSHHCITLPPLRRLRSPAQQTADKQRSRGSP
ncbi:hypothetical protein N0V91_011012 [Didymella pomorum]|uniref:Uncharacterized protein n=1 Tax=Didymella pomorum TaxID=749634 RepID=A0A9W9D0P2_9PLEO|nr:hypothetical protein N0V91_011012 [Didymella pomorum]